MKRIIAAAIIVAVVVGVLVVSGGRERRIQLLQKGTPIAAAGVSLLGGQGAGLDPMVLTTSADGQLRLPSSYAGGLICIKVTKQEAVIAEFLALDIPPGTTIFDFAASNRTIVTWKKPFFGGIVVRTSSSDEIGAPGKGGPGGAVDRSRPVEPDTNQRPSAKGSGG